MSGSVSAPRGGRRKARQVLWVTALSAGGGAVWGVVNRGDPITGALGGAANGAALSFFEGYVLAGWARGALMRLPFGLYFALRAAVYVAVVFAVNVGLFWVVFGTTRPSLLQDHDLGFAFAMCVALNLLFGVNELLGPGVLFAFVAGRYRTPRREERALIYLDLVGSTGLAERLGEARFLDLLNAFFADVTADIVAEGGEIHKYVGDEVIAVWPQGTGPEPPIRAGLAARRRLMARAGFYQAEFGERPQFRAAIHAGPVVIGELGAQKKEIALIGDAMNTAARILEAARETGKAVLISAPFYESLQRALQGVRAERLEPIALRGKSAPLSLISLTAGT